MRIRQCFLVLVGMISIWGTSLTAEEPAFRVFLVGDSIVRGYTPAQYPCGGWGQFMPNHFSKEVQVLNRAIGGRSSKSFIKEGYWKKVLKDLKKGDYVFIQFGNNDQYPRYPKKYTDPDSTYQDFLKQYIKDTKNAGATPILVTMPIRMTRYKKKTGWKESHIQSTWKMPKGTRKTSTTYHDAMRKVAKDTKTPLLDLNKLSKEKLVNLDFDEIKTYYNCAAPGQSSSHPKGVKDLEHNSIKGAAFLAECIASEIRRLKLPLEKYLKKNVKVDVKKGLSIQINPSDIQKRFTLMEKDGKAWRVTDKEATLDIKKDENDTILNFNIAVDHKLDGSSHNGKYPKGWPRIAHPFKKGTVNLNDYSYLRFLIKTKSNRKPPVKTILTVNFACTGAKYDYAIDAGKETDKWKEILVPIKKIISMAGYPSHYWDSLKLIQLVISERWYEDGDKLQFKIKDIELLKTK
jgi:lysophospholipase L1-like esterase